MAVASVVLAAVALVAIAIPVTDAMKHHQQLAAAATANSVKPANGSTVLSRGAENAAAVPEVAAVLQPLPADTPACNGVPGLCSVPVRCVSYWQLHLV